MNDNQKSFNKVNDTLNYFIKTQNIPHIIFHGESGSGKHTFVCNFINNIYKFDKKNIKTNVMFVNCAHGKGIKFIREDLKFFAKINIQCNSGIIFKTIVLINADFLTIDAQTALRRCIEIFSYNTRFFIIVENKHKLLTPILSRFCEIYIPETINYDNNISYSLCPGEFLNLHQLNLNKKINLIEHEENVEKIIENVFLNFNIADFKNYDLLIQISNTLYENGVSCLAFINYLKKYKKIVFRDTNFQISEFSKLINILLEYDNVKSEFKCEKLLFMYIFNFI
jgi:hypothetical protein